ncbi:LuxR C-terminal-related transcriptional regulator [Ruicaihuangia caeni]|uniref:LuxR C-terminal-related transcriptional regulator n=1 Tax=Ruicaihuangia caeni TaxID=3042517 RepID=UPI00338DF513
MAALEIPRSLSTLIGRRELIRDLARSLARDRLVTLVGAAGVGKTRVAAELAASLVKSYGAVFWCTTRDDVELAVEKLVDVAGDALVVVDAPDEAGVDEVLTRLFGILSSTESLRVLMVRHKRIGVAGEHVHEVGPLANRRSSGRGLDDAGQLFIERARAQCATFDAEQGRDAVWRICDLLNGIPAAIESAASACRAMSLDQIAQILEHPRSDDALRAVLGEYFDQLVHGLMATAQSRRRVWASVTSFSGNFTAACLEAFDAGGRDEMLAEFLEMADDHSLLRATSAGAGTKAFTVPTIHKHIVTGSIIDGSDRAVAGESMEQHVRELLYALAEGWFGPEHERLLAHVHLHRDDVEHVLVNMSKRADEASELIALLTSLRYFWRVANLERFAVALLGPALELVPRSSSSYVRGLAFASYLHLMNGDVALASEAAEAAAQLSEDLRDTTAFRHASITRVMLRLRNPSEVMEAESLLRSSVKASAHLPKELGEQYHFLASALLIKGETRAAEEVCRISLRASLAMNDSWGAANTSLVLAVSLCKMGETRAAYDLARESYSVLQRFGDAAGVRSSLRLLASLAHVNGDWDRSAVLAGAASRLSSELAPLAFFYAEGLEQSLESKLGRLLFHARLQAGAELSAVELLAVVNGSELPHNQSLSALTDREAEIAELVAAGYQNGRIAQELVISRRTVEGHVQRILTKLDFNSRTQIAVWFAEQQQNAGGLSGAGSIGMLGEQMPAAAVLGGMLGRTEPAPVRNAQA